MGYVGPSEVMGTDEDDREGGDVRQVFVSPDRMVDEEETKTTNVQEDVVGMNEARVVEQAEPMAPVQDTSETTRKAMDDPNLPTA